MLYSSWTNPIMKESVFMYSSIHLENFKSFDNITFDFRKNKNEAKKMIAIYGENGSGKSNFVAAFALIKQLLMNRPSRRNEVSQLTNLLTAIASSSFGVDSTTLEWLNEKYVKNMELSSFLRLCRMKDCVEPTVVEVCFFINNAEGRYTLKYDKQIISEELYYLDNKRRTTLFSINKKDNDISIKIDKSINSTSYANEFKELLSQYWGKYSFWGILLDEMILKNSTYIQNNVKSSILNVAMYFMSTSVSSSISNDIDIDSAFVELPILPNIEFGEIEKTNERYLNLYERMLTSYLSQIYSDIVDVFYERKYNNNQVIYRLFVKKRIAGRVREINIDQESTGTRKLVSQLKPLVNVVNGYVSVIDEVDSNIHDLLMKSLLESLEADIPENGQIIFTTHNTLLLESLNPNDVYIINIDADGKKEVNCCNDFDCKRIQKTNNLRNLYLKGLFGGIPYTSGVDFSFVNHPIEESQEVESNE